MFVFVFIASLVILFVLAWTIKDIIEDYKHDKVEYRMRGKKFNVGRYILKNVVPAAGSGLVLAIIVTAIINYVF